VEDRGQAAGFGALLRRYRLAAGLSQEALAERARMSSEGISALERGYRRTPQRDTLALLAEALELDTQDRAEFETAARPMYEPVDSSALPLELTNFIGRATEISEITELVRAHRLVTVIGPGGIGKTQIALRVARILSELDGFDTAFAPFSSIADSLVRSLNNRALLLVLDGCEGLIDEADRVAHALLGGATKLRILATSRESFRTGGEYVYRIPALRETDGIALFMDRALAVNDRFTPDAEDRQLVAEICGQLGGIPAAIEFAASRMSALSVKALAERVAHEREKATRPRLETNYQHLSEAQHLPANTRAKDQQPLETEVAKPRTD
jgi:transcriptional regulator with XRE-family HTH domain